ncbi:MAG: heme ABC transporter ATP-binding protein CcmA [Proteobacteria bacterium SG_bin9]|nr:MAG: heme ABC transporter ATP-binding protein CcmA [Proteobacteria bacterium SG_bin9]
MQLSGKSLGCVRNGRQVFENLDFSAISGEALAVTGPNGAGKSSLLRIVAGLLPPAAGTIALDGGDSEQPPAEQMHYLGHRDPLKPSLTVMENLRFWQAFLGGDGNADAALAATGIAHTAHLPAGFLSAGQRRRLSIARLLTVKRPVWLLDEPTSALDSSGQAMFANAVETHLKSGGILVAATHGPLGVPARTLAIPQTAGAAA